MGNDKFNVLLMRDDSRVKRFRLSPVWIKLAVYSLVLVVGVAGVSIYLGYNYWTKNSELVTINRDLQRQLRETNLHLERLQNVEKILNSNDPDELQSLFGTLSVESQKKKVAQRPPVNLGKLLDRVNRNEVNVDNLSLKKVDSSQLRLTFDLTNVDSAKAVSGHVEISAITKTGEEHTIDAKRADLVYQIQRYKKVVTTFGLPDGVKPASIFAVRIVVFNSAGTVIFSAPFEYERLIG